MYSSFYLAGPGGKFLSSSTEKEENTFVILSIEDFIESAIEHPAIRNRKCHKVHLNFRRRDRAFPKTRVSEFYLNIKKKPNNHGGVFKIELNFFDWARAELKL